MTAETPFGLYGTGCCTYHLPARPPPLFCPCATGLPMFQVLNKPIAQGFIAWATIAAMHLSAGATDYPSHAPPGPRIEGCRIQFAGTVMLASDRPGILSAVAKPGTLVRRGADVASLDDRVLAARRAVAKHQAANDIEVRFARKAAELAQLKYQRAMAANQSLSGTVSELELQEIRLAAEKAALQHEQAEHTQAIASLQLAEIDAQLALLHLRAPSDVFVRSVFKQPGEMVMQGEEIAELVNTSTVLVHGHASLADATHLAIGKRIVLQLGGEASGPCFEGDISFVDVEIEPVSQRIAFTARVPNQAGRIRAGQAGTVILPIERQAGSLNRSTPMARAD